MNSSSASAPKKSVFAVPGFGKSLNYIPGTTRKSSPNGPYFELEDSSKGNELFPNAVNTLHLDYGLTQLPLITTREIGMLQAMNEFTDRPNWHLEILDKKKRYAWRSKALAVFSKQYLSKKGIRWCTEELRYRADTFIEMEGALSVYNGDVVKSDIAIPSALLLALQSTASALEATKMEGCGEFSSLSGTRVLIDPFLYPLVFGKTRVLLDRLVSREEFIDGCGEGFMVPIPPQDDIKIQTFEGLVYGDPLEKPYNRNFQWLPSDIDVSGNDGAVKITSYINNLHPHQYSGLYDALERIIGRIIPLWNMSLGPLGEPLSYRRITYNGPVEDANGNDLRAQPNPGRFEPPPQQEGVDLRNKFKESGLQVIVKLETIHLTPDNPKFPEGQWKMDGQLNEHICATALYCYDSMNITNPEISFRQQSRLKDTDSIKFDPGYIDWLLDVFGIEPCQPAVQFPGEVAIRQGRLITWPNVLQHQFTSFTLDDLTKPGHLKLLTIFLVDPHMRIISTANVPCQQKSWWVDAIRQSSNKLNKLPVEVQNLIYDGVEEAGFLLGINEARISRERYIAEREEFMKIQTKTFIRNYFTSNVRPELSEKEPLGSIFPNSKCDHCY